MEIVIDNITWDFEDYGGYDEDFLGMAYVGIPGKIMHEFIQECAWDEEELVPPHEDPYHVDDYVNIKGVSEHECSNADTQIVLMHWMYDQKSKYKLPYRGFDPFWIFHDHFHALNDVMSYEVSNVYSNLEHYRLIEGADFAKSRGIYMKPKTIIQLNQNWHSRFNYREGAGMTPFNPYDFESYVDEEDKEEFEFRIDVGYEDDF